MARITIVSWRDIPAQVIVGKGRSAAKVQLSERFEQAIDRAAMRTGARGDADYLGEWRRTDAGEAEGDPATVATSLAASIEADHTPASLAALVENGGRRQDEP